MDRPLLKKWIQYLVVAGIIFCCPQQPLYAQNYDSVNLSDDFLVDTTVPAAPVTVEEQYDDEYGDYEEEDEDEETVQYFLPFDSLRLKAEASQYKLRPTSESTISSWKKRDEFWYADLSFAEKPKERKSGGSFWMSDSFFMILTVIAIAAFAGLLVVYLGNTNGGLFRRNREIVRQDDANMGIPEDIFAISYEKEIHRAEQEKDYRLATRLRFLQLLKEMSNQNIIQYLDERTNLDYLMQLHKTAWYDDFFRLTRHFEYTWYGLFEVGPEQYARIKTDFENVHKRFY